MSEVSQGRKESVIGMVGTVAVLAHKCVGRVSFPPTYQGQGLAARPAPVSPLTHSSPHSAQGSAIVRLTPRANTQPCPTFPE